MHKQGYILVVVLVIMTFMVFLTGCVPTQPQTSSLSGMRLPSGINIKKVTLRVVSEHQPFQIKVRNNLEQILLQNGFILVEKGKSTVEICVIVTPPRRNLLINSFPGNQRRIGSSIIRITNEGKLLTTKEANYGNPGESPESVANDVALALIPLTLSVNVARN